MDAVQLAYVAGLVDGEGCIHLECSRTTYRPRVTVGMSEIALPLLTELREEWGGSLYLQRKQTAKWAAAWTWHTGGPEAARLLRSIRPHLRLKTAQAEAALWVHEIWEGLERTPNGRMGRWTPEARAACEELKQRLHVLNAKGPRVKSVEAA
jgi:hypothetical protein